MFMSEYYHSLDPKGRLIVPVKIREQLGEECVITRGLDRCLTIYPLEEWDLFRTRLGESVDLSQEKGRMLERFFIAGAAGLEIDKQGRILIPPNLRNFAGLNKDVVLAGVRNRVELWDRETWEQKNVFDDIASWAAEMPGLKL